ncbi:LOW QUALITY PROTEIN: Lipase 3 [Gryllus bimaculatus]|nr:LOW QUALITY PROTEIN: Lipase 3 [Gryllus bimaculatus]
MALSIGVLGLGLLASAFASYNIDQDVHLDTVGLLRKYGYPAEAHEVTTADGYILTLHRVPHSPSSPPGGRGAGGRRPVVFLQHGLVCSSADWVVMGPGVAPAYVLADAGYDVWMGNFRGNKYSRRHTSLSPDGLFNSKFWNFDWHEMGIYDMPASIDYVLETTGEEKLFYIGHSMGTTSFWVMNAVRPEFNAKFRAMFALAPVVYVRYVPQPLLRAAAYANKPLEMWDYGPTNIFHYGSRSPPKYNLSKVTAPVALYYSIGDTLTDKMDVDRLYRNTINPIGKFQIPKDHFSHMDFIWGIHSKELIFDLIIANFQIGYNEVKKGNPQNTIFGTICRHKLPYKTMCDNLIYFLCGYDPEELNSTMLPVLMSHTPAGASSKTLLHFLQEILSDEFQMWDYGLTNIFHYGSLSPPKYNVSKVTVPVAIHYSIGDRITGKTDVDRLFRNTRNTIGKFQVPKDHFSHMDFVWGVHSKELIYDLIIGLMSRV